MRANTKQVPGRCCCTRSTGQAHRHCRQHLSGLGLGGDKDFFTAKALVKCLLQRSADAGFIASSCRWPSPFVRFAELEPSRHTSVLCR